MKNTPATWFLPRYINDAKDGIDVGLKYKMGVTDSVEIFARTQCTDHPRNHQMLRSTLDPGYGKTSGYYPRGVDLSRTSVSDIWPEVNRLRDVVEFRFNV